MSKIVSATIINEISPNALPHQFRIRENNLKILLSKPLNFECFIGKPQFNITNFIAGSMYNNSSPEKALLLNDTFLKSSLDKLTMENLREFAYLTIGNVEFLLISDDNKRAAFRINGGRMLRVKIYTKKTGKVGDEIFI